jgi:hypothetical protein
LICIVLRGYVRRAALLDYAHRTPDGERRPLLDSDVWACRGNAGRHW